MSHSSSFLFINQSYPPDTAASGVYLSDLASHLAEKGFKVTVLCSKSAYYDKDQIYEDAPSDNGVSVIRAGRDFFSRTSKVFRFLNSVAIGFSFAWRLFRTPKHDYVISTTSPPFAPFLGLLATRFWKARSIAWVMDLQPEQAIAVNLIRKRSFLAYALQVLNTQWRKKTDLLISLDQAINNRLLASGAKKEKSSVSPLWCREEVVSISHTENRFRNEQKFNDKFVVMYSGNHGLSHPLMTLLEAAEVLKADESVHFCFIGAGANYDSLKQVSEGFKLSNVSFLPTQTAELLSNSLSAADLHIVSIAPECVGLIHPSKVYGIISVLRPFLLLGPSGSFIDQILKDLSLPAAIPHGGVSELVSAIKQIQAFSKVQRSTLDEALTISLKGFEARKSLSNLANKIIATCNNPHQ